MKLVSPLLKHVVYPAFHYSGQLSRIPLSGGCVAINYHGVLPPDHLDADPFLDGNLVRVEQFRRQLQFLKLRYQVISPDDFRSWIEQGAPLPPSAALITCDDGLLNTLTDMLPVLQTEDVRCLFFVTAASCGNHPGMLWYEELHHLMRAKPLTDAESQLPTEDGTTTASEGMHARWWSAVRRASRLEAAARADWIALLRSSRKTPDSSGSERRWRLLNATELTQLAAAGMTIGAHTVSHPVLSLCSDAEAKREIQASKAEIERVLGQTSWAFAYPFGDFLTMGQREMHLAQESGFSCAFLNILNGPPDRPKRFELPRVHVTLDMKLPEFAAHVSGLHARLQRAVRG